MQNIIILLALVLSVANAARLRETNFPLETHLQTNVGVSDISLIEALASKYNCREGGATLEETLCKIIHFMRFDCSPILVIWLHAYKAKRTS